LEAKNRTLAKSARMRHPTFIIEEKVSKEWVGEGHMIAFEILSKLQERLCTQETGQSIAPC
jgi:hypothetical protein